MKKIVIVAAALLLSNMAFAEGSSDNGSQYQHQTASGLFELTPAISYESTTKKFKDGSAKHDFTIMDEKLMAEYGINDMFSVGITLTNTDTKDKSGGSTTKYSGLMDPDLFLNGRAMVGPGSLRFGTHLTLTPGDMKANDQGNYNGYDGANTLTPFVGYEMKSSASTYGLRLAFDLWKSDGTVKSDQFDPQFTAKSKDGKVLTTSVFFEQDMNPVTLGASIALENHQKIKLQGTGDYSGFDSEGLPAYNRVDVNVYAAYMATDSITILPTLTFVDYSAGPKNVDSQSGFAGQIAGRFAF